MSQTIDRPRTRRAPRPTANDLARKLLRELDRERTEKRIKTKGQVYFLRAYEGRHAGLVKIGTTVNLDNRIATLRRGHFLYHRIDADLAENFARQVETGAHLTENSAALQLRNKLWSSKAAEHRMQADVEFAWILNAIAFDLEGSKRKKIRWWTPGGGLWPYLKQLPPTVQPYPWIELP